MKDYRFVECIYGKPSQRNTAGRVTEIAKVQVQKSVPGFVSLFLFDENLMKHYEKHHSVKGYQGKHLPNGITVDFDNKEDPEQARLEAVKLVKILEHEYEVPPEYLRIAFSGHKGFHVTIPVQAVKESPVPHTHTFLHVSSFVKRIADALSFDRSIYKITGLIRLTNSRHDTSKLYKIPLTPRELEGWDIGKIREEAKRPRQVYMLPVSEIEPLERLTALWDSINPDALVPHSTSPTGSPPTEQQAPFYEMPEDIEGIIDACKKCDDHDDWIKIGYALVNFGEAGRPYFVELTVENPNYQDSAEAADKKFNTLLNSSRHEVGTGTLVKLAKKYGYQPTPPKSQKGSAAKTIKKAKSALNQWYEFRHDVIKDSVVYRPIEREGFIEMQNRDSNTIYLRLQTAGISISETKFQALLNSDFVPRYNPINDYLRSLSWDGHNHIEDFSETVLVRNDQKAWSEALMKWLVGAVAGTIDDRQYNETCLILQGSQGIGKTRWIRRLVPDRLQDYLFSGNIRPENKDDLLQVVRNFIINLDELESLRRDDVDSLKAMLSEKMYKIRRPYRRNDDIFIRRSSFLGSVNRLQFLNDATGNRRFLAFAVESIDLNNTVDIDQVWAQAYQLYLEGQSWYFTGEEIQEINDRNEEFCFRTFEEEKLLLMFEPTEEYEQGARMLSATEIAEELFENGRLDNKIIRNLGQALQKHGFTQKIVKITSGEKKGSTKRAYAVRRADVTHTVDF